MPFIHDYSPKPVDLETEESLEPDELYSHQVLKEKTIIPFLNGASAIEMVIDSSGKESYRYVFSCKNQVGRQQQHLLGNDVRRWSPNKIEERSRVKAREVGFYRPI